MRYVDEYRDPQLVATLVKAISRTMTRPWRLMELCGGQTWSLMRYALPDLLPDTLTLLHGPGCPVCVTPVSMIDHAHAIAARPEVLFTSFGDMLRVPGSNGDLQLVRSRGADVRMLFSPLEALELARNHPDREIVFFAVGFETTVPATALVVERAVAERIKNLSFLVSHLLIPPAMEAIAADAGNQVEAFLAAGHVCAITGFGHYHALAERWKLPIVPTGFEPVDLLAGILQAVTMLESGEWGVVNRYGRAVTPDGNPVALQKIQQVFEPVTMEWRGIGPLANSGLKLRDTYAAYDAACKFPVQQPPSRHAERSERCRSGEVLQGRLAPEACPAFGSDCTPLRPLGAPMVTSEGACAASYSFQQQRPRP